MRELNSEYFVQLTIWLPIPQLRIVKHKQFVGKEVIYSEYLMVMVVQLVVMLWPNVSSTILQLTCYHPKKLLDIWKLSKKMTLIVQITKLSNILMKHLNWYRISEKCTNSVI